MGANRSKQRPPPVQGFNEDNRLSIIPVFRTSLRESYTLPRATTLRLNKSRLWSVDSNVLDYRGFYVFRKTGSVLSNLLEFCDDAGNVLASYEKKSSCGESIAMITLGSNCSPSSDNLVATLEYKPLGPSSGRCDIYLHHQDTREQGRVGQPDILVRGAFGRHEYSFSMMGTKIAQVLNGPENHMYSLEIGAWVDIAFITICASAVDLLQIRSRLNPLSYCTSGCLLFSPCSPCGRDNHERSQEEPVD